MNVLINFYLLLFISFVFEPLFSMESEVELTIFNNYSEQNGKIEIIDAILDAVDSKIQAYPNGFGNIEKPEELKQALIVFSEFISNLRSDLISVDKISYGTLNKILDLVQHFNANDTETFNNLIREDIERYSYEEVVDSESLLHKAWNNTPSCIRRTGMCALFVFCFG